MTMDGAVYPDDFQTLRPQNCEGLFSEPLRTAQTRLGIRPATAYAAVPATTRAALKLRA